MVLRIGIYGFGSIGRLVFQEAVRRGYEVVGVIDIREDIVGRDAGVVAGIGEYGVEVSSEPYSLVDSDVVVHATTSFLDEAYDQLVRVIEMGIDLVSTCETLAYPYYRYPVLARKLHYEAIRNNVSVIGSGINPGFLLDTLAVVLATTVTRVYKIEAIRSLDASKRRESFRKKIGIGLEPRVAREKLGSRELTGHVGYAESVYLVADALGVELERVDENQEVVVENGVVKGIRGYGVGYSNGRELIRIEFHAYTGAEEYEEIRIHGKDYTVTWRSNGTLGDQGTVAVVLAIAEKIKDYPPGLLTITDLLPFKPWIEI